MSFRARLSLTWLEARENPSTPGADPFGGDAPPASEPPPAPPADPTPAQTAEAAAIAGATVPPTTPPAPPPDTTATLYQLP